MQKLPFIENWTVTDETGRSKTVCLPHDAMFERVRSRDAKAGDAQGYYPGGAYVYEKTFEAPAEWENQTVLFQFEGVYQDAKVYFNGEPAEGPRPYGYIPFFVSADGRLKYGEVNTIRVECDNMNQPASRWYSGAGIYRPVWLWVGGKDAICPEGIRCTTKSVSPAVLEVSVQTVGAGDAVEVCLCEKGMTDAVVTGEAAVADGLGTVTLDVPDARLWSAEDPFLYDVCVTLKKGGEAVDCAVERTGIRQIAWNAAQGLLVNGKSVLLQGGCIHHDNGVLGAKTFAKAEARRVRILKEAGFNAIRMAHNPASPALIAACDEIGMYLMDEAWDMWYQHKNPGDYATFWEDHYLDDLKAMVDRGYNHPSIILWSIGNEVSEPAKEKGIEKTKEMVAHLHRIDGTRPVTGGFNLMIISQAAKGKGLYEEGGAAQQDKTKDMGMNSTMYNMIVSMVGTGMTKAANSSKVDKVCSPSLDALDIAGYNYASGRYPMEGKLHPDRVVFGSETFPQDIAKNWDMVKKLPYVVGDFMWTSWDYLGENGIGAWTYEADGGAFAKPYPWKLADAGAFNIIGDGDAQVALAQAAWDVTDVPFVGVQPCNHPNKVRKAAWRGTNAMASWSWKGCDGAKCVLEVYSNAASCEVAINGKSLGKKKLKGCKATFKASYQPGTLTVTAYDAAGSVTGTNTLTSAAGALSLVPAPEETCVAVGDIAYIPVSICGENGVLESNADAKVTVSVEGGELVGFGSANPRGEENYLDGAYTTWYGRALAVVKATAAGKIKVTFSAKGFADASAEIEAK